MNFTSLIWQSRLGLWPVREVRASRYVLDCRIESGAHLFYEMDAEGEVRHIAEPVPDCAMVSAIYPVPGRADDESAEDYRFHLPRRMSAGQAANWFQRELGLFVRMRVLVNPEHPEVIYATLAGKVDIRGKIHPLAHAVEKLMQLDDLVAPCVTGVLFGESSLLILLAFPGNGRVFVQTSVAPDNLAEIITSFASINGISIDLETMPLYTGKELFGVLSGTPAYPVDPEWVGIPLPRLVGWSMAGLALCLLAGISGHFLMQYHVGQLKSEIARLSRQKDELNQQIVSRLANNPTGLARLLSVDFVTLVRHARMLWVPGSHVESRADGGIERHLVELPVRRTAGEVADAPAGIVALLDLLEPGNGCRSTGEKLTGDVMEFRAGYVCGSADPVRQSLEPNDEAD